MMKIKWNTKTFHEAVDTTLIIIFNMVVSLAVIALLIKFPFIIGVILAIVLIFGCCYVYHSYKDDNNGH